jgi:hypothetical protein
MVAAIGGYYLLVSPAARRLAGVEEDRINVRRVRLRRLNGLILIGLGLAMMLMFAGAERKLPWPVAIGGLTVMLLLPIALGLALYDLRLTRRLRGPRNPDSP